MSFRALALAPVLTLLWGAATAQAHFIFVVVDQADGQPAVKTYFSEGPEPGEAFLVKRMQGIKVFVPKGDKADLKQLEVQPVTGEKVGHLEAKLEGQAPSAAAAMLKYGVFTRGETSSLLQYYAKYLTAGVETPAAINEKLALDIRPVYSKNGCQAEVYWKGQPAKGAELHVTPPEDFEEQLQPTEEGGYAFDLGKLKPGTYALRAKVVQSNEGELDGKAYTQELHFCTLTLNVPGSSENTSATDLLETARQRRAEWQNFPGFTAKVAVSHQGESGRGMLTVSAEGEVKLEGLSDELTKLISPSLESMVGHRMPGGEGEADPAAFVDAQTDHPLGRLVKPEEASAMASTYRVANGVLRQVNRQTPGGKFTISVLAVHENPEGKTLPNVYTVSFWNPDGSLRSATTVRDEWVRVGHLDLPTSHFRVTTGKDQYEPVEVQFSNHQLLPTSAE